MTPYLKNGSDGCIILDPRADYCRETNLPADWTRVRLGFYLGEVGLAGLNADPTPEAMTPINRYDYWFVGLTNGVGFPQEAGNRFVGAYTYYSSLTYSNPYWAPWTSMLPEAWISDGTLAVANSQEMSSSSPAFKAPSGVAEYAAFIGFEIQKSNNTAIIRFLNGYSTPVTDCSGRALLAQLLAASSGFSATAPTGASWWTAGTNIGLRHLFIRSPHRYNRLRIHASAVYQIA